MKNNNIEGVLILVMTLLLFMMVRSFYRTHGMMKGIGTGLFTVGYILVIIGYIRKTEKNRKNR